MVPRSIRGRFTLISTVVAAMFVIPAAVAAVLFARYAIRQYIEQEVDSAARRISNVARGERLINPIPTDQHGVSLAQVVDAHGRVTHASRTLAGRPALSTLRPSPDNRVQHLTVRLGDDRLLLTAIRLTSDPGAPVVLAGRPEPDVLATPWLPIGVAATVMVVIGGVAWGTWRVVGRTLRPVEDIRGQLAHITGTDLSRRVERPSGQDEVAQLAGTVNETLDRLERAIEQQRRFASDASHELRTPIAGLRAQLEAALLHPDDTDLLLTIKAALRDADRLEAIVTDLLLLARLGSEGLTVHETVDLGDLAATELARRQDQIPVTLSLDEGVLVDGVRGQLARALRNLLDNAVQHAEATVDIAVRGTDGQAVLSVTDDGSGIAADDREQVFKRFTRLDAGRSRDVGGTGLGLAIARSVATAHHGTLTIEDSPRGARFVLRLPMVTD